LTASVSEVEGKKVEPVLAHGRIDCQDIRTLRTANARPSKNETLTAILTTSITGRIYKKLSYRWQTAGRV